MSSRYTYGIRQTKGPQARIPLKSKQMGSRDKTLRRHKRRTPLHLSQDIVTSPPTDRVAGRAITLAVTALLRPRSLTESAFRFPSEARGASSRASAG